MKKILLLISLFFLNLNFAQTNIWVEYTQTYHTDIPFIRAAVLQIQKDNSIYVSKLSSDKNLISKETAIKNIDKLLNSENTSQREIILNSNKKDKYFLKNLKNMDFYFTGKIGGKEFYIRDNYKLNWQITPETKTIANYKVHKATTKFRGRIWEAWFAPDLAYPFGPWKLHGLPGLILEAYDESKTYNYIATKINTSENVIQFENKNLTEISLKKYINLEEEYYDNLFSSNIDPRYQKTLTKSTTKGQEFDFEWETEK